MHSTLKIRTAAEALVDQLFINGVRHVFCVPGESYLLSSTPCGTATSPSPCVGMRCAAMMARRTAARPGGLASAS